MQEIGPFRRFEMPYIRSNMYAAVEEGSALIVDPVFSEEAEEYLRGCGVKSALILLTHEHFDHTSGIGLVEALFPTRLVCTAACAEYIANVRNNRPLAMVGLLNTFGREEISNFFSKIGRYVCTADETFEDSLEFTWNAHRICLKSTIGHSLGSCCLEFDGKYVFTGDSLIPGDSVFTRFPGGSAEDYVRSALPYLLSLPQHSVILPGHGLPCLMKNVYGELQAYVRTEGGDLNVGS